MAGNWFWLGEVDRLAQTLEGRRFPSAKARSWEVGDRGCSEPLEEV